MTVAAWDCANDEYRERAYNGMAAEIAVMRDALKVISDLKPRPVAEGFVSGPQSLLDTAQRRAREALKECRAIERRAAKPWM